MNIGQAAKRSGLSAKMIRHYESIGLLTPAERDGNGYRRYAASDLQRLVFIRRARDLDFSLEDIGRLLALWQDRQRASADVKSLAATHLASLERRIETLVELRDTLRDMIGHCRGDGQPDCPILQELEAGRTEGSKPSAAQGDHICDCR